jgi:hypothetical protein
MPIVCGFPDLSLTKVVCSCNYLCHQCRCRFYGHRWMPEPEFDDEQYYNFMRCAVCRVVQGTKRTVPIGWGKELGLTRTKAVE